MRALLFDFDGLILDTETPEVEVWREIFREHGQEFLDDYWIRAIGRGAEEIAKTPYELLEDTLGYPVDRATLRHEERFEQRMAEPRPLPGVQALIEEAKRESVRIGVASSSKHEWVDTWLARLGLLDSFEAIVCAGDAPRAKPAPDLYLTLLDRLGVAPSEAVALEDSPNGVTAARAAGVFVVVVPNPLTRMLSLDHADARRETLEGVTLATLRALRSPA